MTVPVGRCRREGWGRIHLSAHSLLFCCKNAGAKGSASITCSACWGRLTGDALGVETGAREAAADLDGPQFQSLQWRREA